MTARLLAVLAAIVAGVTLPFMLVAAARAKSLKGARPGVKDCPVCGNRAAPTQFTCRSCGYHYPGYISPLHYAWIAALTVFFWWAVNVVFAALAQGR